MGLQKGGYKLKKIIRDNLRPGEDIFMTYILPMIMDPESEIEIIDSDSAYGFVASMRVKEEKSPFVDDDGNTAIDFVFKGCKVSNKFTCQGARKLEKKAPDQVFRRPVTPEDFMGEAKVQQETWENSLLRGLPPICPSLTDATIIKHDDERAVQLINALFANSPAIADYMKSEIVTKGYDLGVMTMQKIEGVLFRDLPDDDKYLPVLFLCASAMRLFLVDKVINMDANQGNCFFNLETQEGILIDYGRVITPSRAVRIINMRGDALYHSGIQDEYQLGLISKSLKEYQKLLYCFEKASEEFSTITNVDDARRLIKMLTHIEARWYELTFGPPAISCLGEYVLSLGKDGYAEIFKEYKKLTRPTKPPGTPLKESTRVRVVEDGSREPEQRYFLSSSEIEEANLEYSKMFTDTYIVNPARGVSSSDQARWSDERAHEAAIANGTPYTPDYCEDSSFYSDSSDMRSFDSEHSELPLGIPEVRRIEWAPGKGPGTGIEEPRGSDASTVADDLDTSTELDTSFSDNDDVDANENEAAEVERPYNAKRGPEGQNPIGNSQAKPRFGGKSRRKKTKRKRKTKTTNRFKKQKTRKQRKRKTRKLH